MGNESMANYITDTPSEIAELLAINEKLQAELAEKDKEIIEVKKDAIALAEYFEQHEGGWFRFKEEMMASKFLLKYKQKDEVR